MAFVAFNFGDYKQYTNASVSTPTDGFEFLVVRVGVSSYVLPYIGEKNGVLLFGDNGVTFQPDQPDQLGSGLIDHIQKMTIAAIAMADMKVWAQRS